MNWDQRDAVERIAQEKADAEAGPCLNCGGPAHVDLLDISTWTEAAFTPGIAHCAQECWREDPEGYLAAVRQMPGIVKVDWTLSHEEVAEFKQLWTESRSKLPSPIESKKRWWQR